VAEDVVAQLVLHLAAHPDQRPPHDVAEEAPLPARGRRRRRRRRGACAA
jgi:hypothetical protein